MFEIIFAVILSIYFLQSFLFVIGAKKKYPKIKESELPSISVVVAARNEEYNIKDCLVSLDQLIYPEDKIEIFVVNDKSTDGTGDIIKEFVKNKRKFNYLEPKESIGELKGKTNALANAIKKSSGEIILTTDADCVVSPTWAKAIASYYKPDVAMVCGYTNQIDDNTFGGMQSLDFVYLLVVAAGAMNLGKPLSCIGNNMSYRKSVYDELGGYEALPFSVTEDFNLLMAIHKLKKYKIIYPLDINSLVTSKPCPTLKSLYWQKKRWGVGGMKSDIVGYSVMASGFLSHIMILLAPFFFSALSLYLMFFKMVVDFFFIKPAYQKLNLKLKFSHFLAFEIYFIIYVVILPFVVLPKREIKWKGRKFN